MNPTARQTRWSARVDRDDWDSLRDAADARGIRVDELITGSLEHISPTDLGPCAAADLVFVRSTLPDPARVKIRELAYFTRVRVADVIHTLACRVQSETYARV